MKKFLAQVRAGGIDLACHAMLVVMLSKREQQEAAGRWLRAMRERRGFKTADAFARRIEVSGSLLSRYETGISGVPDDKAEKIAEVLGMDIIEVRRNLGLWVPPQDPSDAGEPPATLSIPSDEELLAMVPAAIAERDRGNPESYNLLMFVWHTRHPEQRDTTKPDATSTESDQTA